MIYEPTVITLLAMKKLVYLKKFNEASEEECDFETFKEIMMDLSDYFQCEFHDYTKEDDYFYDCELTIPQIDMDQDISFNGEYLSNILPPYDDPPKKLEDFTKVLDMRLITKKKIY